MERKKNILIQIFLLFVLTLAGCSGDKGQGLKVGEQFPDLNLLDMEGRQVTLSSQLKAKTRLISIRTLGCRYCESDFAELERIYQQFGRDKLDVAVIGVAMEQEVMEAFMKGIQVSFQVFVDENSEVMQRTNSVILPVAYVIDPTNRILYRVQGALGRTEMEEVLSSFVSP